MRRSLLSAVLSLSVLLSTLVAAQGAWYTFTTFDVPGAGVTQAHGINEMGQIVGIFNNGTGTHGFLKDGDTYTSLDVPGVGGAEAHGINETGQIVGLFGDDMGTHGFLKDGDTYTSLDVPGAGVTLAFGINTAGQIVGTFRENAASRNHGFLKDGDTYTSLDVPGAVFTEAFGINETGQIVGLFGDASRTHGFLKDGDTYITFDVPGTGGAEAYGINETGQIVGLFGDGMGIHGFLKDGNTFTRIDVPGATFTWAYGINDSGQIVGRFQDATGALHGFLATPGEGDNIPPVITVSASPATLSPPNGKLVTVTVSGTIVDDEPDDSGVQAGSTVYMVIDEYGQMQPSGSFTLDADGGYRFTVKLQASKNGNDKNGRHYTIEVSATDHAGNTGTESAIVTVPRK